MSESARPEPTPSAFAGRFPPRSDAAARPVSGRQPDASTAATSVAPNLPAPPAGTAPVRPAAQPAAAPARPPGAGPLGSERPAAPSPAPGGAPPGGSAGWRGGPQPGAAHPAAAQPSGPDGANEPGRLAPRTGTFQPYQAGYPGPRLAALPGGAYSRPVAPAVKPAPEPTALPYRMHHPHPLPSSAPSGATLARPAHRPDRRPLIVSGILLVVLAMIGGVVLRFGLADRPTQWRQLGDSPDLAHRQGSVASTAPIPTYHTEVTAELSRGVALIFGKSPEGRSAGSGMVLTSDGLVLTNYHVGAGTHELQVEINDTKQQFAAHVVGRNLMADVALVKLENASGLVTIALSDQHVSPGDRVVAVGNAGGEGILRGTGGSVSRVNTTIWLDSAYGGYGEDPLMGVIESSAGAVPGYSGGPTFNQTAEAIGITSAGQQEESSQMVSYTIPIDHAMHVVDDILAGRESPNTRIGPRPLLGLDLGEEDVPKVHGVTRGSPADAAGIVAGATIVSFNGTPVDRAHTLLRLLDGTDPDQTVEVTWRDSSGQEHSGQVTLGTNPAN